MDHLSQVSDPAFPPLKVRYISQEDYDGNGFQEYPERRGWDKKRLLRGDFSEHPADRTASFLQAWLYFGMLHEVLGIPIKMEDFVHEGENNDRIVNTSELPRYITDWKKRFDALSENQQKEEWSKVNACLGGVSSLMAFASWGGDLDAKQVLPLSPEASLSIMVLGYTLDCAKNHIHKAPKSNPYLDLTIDMLNPYGPKELFHWGTSALTVSRMLNAGWCPNSIARLRDIVGPPGMFFVSCFRRKGVRDNHQRCTMEECVADQIDAATYETKHVTEDCQCKHMSPDPEKIKAIVAAGGVPIIKIAVPEGSDTPRVDVIGGGGVRIGYVAISHVWADGLGNAEANSLPTCQLLRLKGLVSKLYRPQNDGKKQTTWFDMPGTTTTMEDIFALLNQEPVDDSDDSVCIWIDTLCVPLEGQLRKRAIRTMVQVYKDARDVLILDGELQQTPIDLPAEELLIRIGCSSWMKRLWTLQEGVQAQNLHVQFEGDTFDIINALVAMKFDYRQTIQLEAFRIVSDLRWKDEWQVRTKAMLVAQAWKAFQWRSTSRKSDETICAGTLLELDIMELSDLHPRDRMKNLLAQLRVFPAGIIFLRGPRIQQDGWRWALSSFGKMTGNINDQSPALLNSSGLMVKFPGFIFLEYLKPELREGFGFVDTIDQRQYNASFFGDEDGMALWSQSAPLAGMRLALIVGGAITPFRSTAAILVSIFEEKNEILYTKFLCRMAIRCEELRAPSTLESSINTLHLGDEKSAVNDMPPLDSSSTGAATTRGLAVSVKSTNPRQKWCVG